MPANSVMYVYGGLSMSACANLSQMDFLAHNKRLEGLWLAPWTKKQSIWRMWRTTSGIANALNTRMKSEIAASFPLEGFREAIASY
jgi:hypothetical protein